MFVDVFDQVLNILGVEARKFERPDIAVLKGEDDILRDQLVSFVVNRKCRQFVEWSAEVTVEENPVGDLNFPLEDIGEEISHAGENDEKKAYFRAHGTASGHNAADQGGDNPAPEWQ